MRDSQSERFTKKIIKRNSTACKETLVRMNAIGSIRRSWYLCRVLPFSKKLHTLILVALIWIFVFFSYGVQLSTSDGENYSSQGSFTCLLEGSYVGYQNISFIVSEDYGRSLPLSSSLKVSANNLLYMFQTFAGEHDTFFVLSLRIC